MKTIWLKIPNAVAQYFRENHGDLTELSQGLLNDCLRSILQLEAPENPEAADLAEEL